MTNQDQQILDKQFKRIRKSRYAEVYYSDQLKTIVCLATQPYIPINRFRRLFNRMARFIKKNPVELFIFDKRALETFDQPSMEWYFTDWKPRMAEFGLTTYRKILPAAEWFAQAVEAGKADIKRKMPDNPAFGYDIQYTNDYAEALGGVAASSEARPSGAISTKGNTSGVAPSAV